MLFRPCRSPAALYLSSFHFFQIPSNFALCKNLSLPQMRADGYNQVKREEEGFPENNEKKEREKTMEKMLLNENWKLRDASETEWIPGTVPGSVYQDYLNAGKMEDPYWRANEEQALELMKRDFEYRTVFDVSGDMLAHDEVILHFDGIDTVADICLNGQTLGHVDNMHRTWEYRVKELLKKEGNELSVRITSPVNYIYDLYEKDPLIVGSSDAMRGCSYLRKAHCMYGWDWGPRLPDAGIWRPVSLLGVDAARFDNVYVTQNHEQGKVTLNFQADIELLGAERLHRLGGNGAQKDADRLEQEGMELHITVTAPDGTAQKVETGRMQTVIENPQLWWPNGYGDQPLYGVKVELCRDGKVLDVWEKRIGLRTMRVVREKDQWGESFCHEVNGVRIFAMGADYIPEDNILPRVTPERTRDLLLQAKNAHFNCIRVWGGGHYPADAFWDICDELGLIVWEDFMFACGVYDLTEEFEANIRAEFIDNVKRIRHHASLGLWCGNNEIEQFLAENDAAWCLKPSQLSDYFKMYEYIIPKVLKEYDPQTFYWPASPSSGGSFDCPNDENRGDVHYWDVWHGNKPITEFRKFFFRYLSEFGFQSFPALKTVETFTLPEDRNIFSYVMEKHQRNQSANGKIMNYMEQTFLYPNDFDTLLYASQLLQAEAMRYGVEHFRRNRGRCMGTIIWQLNDCWPVASWAMIDYEGRWKAVQYYAKRFFAPLMISCEEEGILSQNTNVNAEPFELKKSIRLCVSSESMQDHQVTVRWQLREASGQVKEAHEEELCVKALSSEWLERVPLQYAQTRRDYVSYELLENGEIVSAGSVLFCAPKHFQFENPHLKVEAVGSDEILVTADAYAKSVEILNGNDTMLLSDNYFDMNPGTRRLKVLKGVPEGLKVRSVFDIR